MMQDANHISILLKFIYDSYKNIYMTYLTYNIYNLNYEKDSQLFIIINWHTLWAKSSTDYIMPIL